MVHEGQQLDLEFAEVYRVQQVPMQQISGHHIYNLIEHQFLLVLLLLFLIFLHNFRNMLLLKLLRVNSISWRVARITHSEFDLCA